MIADTGVDSHEIFRHLASRGIKPVIEVRRDAVITSNKARDEVVREIRKGRKRWKEKKWIWKAVARGEFLFVI